MAWPGVLPYDDAEEKGPTTPREIALEIAAFIYYAGTIVEFCVDELTEATLKATVVDEPSIVERLALARQYFAVSPFVAWRSLTTFRDLTHPLEPWASARPSGDEWPAYPRDPHRRPNRPQNAPECASADA